MGIIRILVLADTHLGLDLPFRPRIQRRRRGPEFFANFERALQPAMNGRVDCVVHCGDLLHRSKVPARLVALAFEPLMQVADLGIPIYIVPGNHERSAIPHCHLAEHPNIRVFHQPRTYFLQKENFTLILAGFPFVRHKIRREFLPQLDRTGWRNAAADVRLLCIHQAVDGATVGPVGYTFRHAPDVIRASDIPAGFSAVLSGHIHRFQVLHKTIRGKTLNAPVFYPGSIERTSFAERFEKKGYLILEFESGGSGANALKNWAFHELPARPMVQLVLNASGINGRELESFIKLKTADLPEDSIVKLKIHGKISPSAETVLRAASLRSLAPPSMNIDASFKGRKFN